MGRGMLLVDARNETPQHSEGTESLLQSHSAMGCKQHAPTHLHARVLRFLPCQSHKPLHARVGVAKILACYCIRSNHNI
jgi:hypothetical protein